jgi:hypothetical protein
MTKKTLTALKILALAAGAAAAAWLLLRKKKPAPKEPTVVVSTDDPNMVVGDGLVDPAAGDWITGVDYVPNTAGWKT